MAFDYGFSRAIHNECLQLILLFNFTIHFQKLLTEDIWLIFLINIFNKYKNTLKFRNFIFVEQKKSRFFFYFQKGRNISHYHNLLYSKT